MMFFLQAVSERRELPDEGRMAVYDLLPTPGQHIVIQHS